MAYPFDVARRRLQVSGWKGAKSLHATPQGGEAIVYKGMMDCFIKTVREEGFGALFKVSWIKTMCTGRGLDSQIRAAQVPHFQPLALTRHHFHQFLSLCEEPTHGVSALTQIFVPLFPPGSGSKLC